ncbi:MAG: hypothetical protein IPJ90_20560 [Anaerolineaceae bacterium]|nr:hypothetical protein [Anaerolineaceae bacterium]
MAPLITIILNTLTDILPEEKEYIGMENSNDVSLLFTEFQSYEMPDDDFDLVNSFFGWRCDR